MWQKVRVVHLRHVVDIGDVAAGLNQIQWPVFAKIGGRFRPTSSVLAIEKLSQLTDTVAR